jgi:hypothetical protein
VARAARQARVVDKDVDGAELGLDGVESSLDGCFVRDFKSQGEDFDVRIGLLDVGFGLLQRLETSGCDDDALCASKGECVREALKDESVSHTGAAIQATARTNVRVCQCL